MTRVPLTEGPVSTFSDAVGTICSRLLDSEKSGKETHLSLKKKILPKDFHEARQCKPSEIEKDAFLGEVLSNLQVTNINGWMRENCCTRQLTNMLVTLNCMLNLRGWNTGLKMLIRRCFTVGVLSN